MLLYHLTPLVHRFRGNFATHMSAKIPSTYKPKILIAAGNLRMNFGYQHTREPESNSNQYNDCMYLTLLGTDRKIRQNENVKRNITNHNKYRKIEE